MNVIKKNFYILHYNKLYKKNYLYKHLMLYNNLIKQLYNLLFYFYILKDFIFYKYLFIKNKIYFLLINIFLFLFNLNIIKILNNINNKKLNIEIKNNLYLYYIYIIKIFIIYNYNLFIVFFYKKNKYNKIFQKIIEIKKISKTRKKGRIRRFKVLLLIGARNYWIGIGIAKDFYLQEAINKARFDAFKKIYFFYIILERIFFYSNILKKIKVIVTVKFLGFGLRTSYLIQVFLDLIGYKNLIIKIYKKIIKYYFIKLFIKILINLHK